MWVVRYQAGRVELLHLGWANLLALGATLTVENGRDGPHRTEATTA